MNRYPLLASLLLLLPLAAMAQDDCYKPLYDKGLAAYNAGRYSEALKKWEAAKTCPDVPAAQDLDSRIRQARAKIPAPKPASKPSTKPTTPSAGDQLWDIVKDSQDPKTVQKYLDQYPGGRHAAAARQRIRELQPAAPATQQAPAGFAFVPGGTF
ncbi:MAG: hypothetical protein IT260_10650 [Saprospiraceae bacterium]|nr:hypothetical protein [Saprospiraceae bacterium]